MSTEDILPQYLRLELFGLNIKARESALGVRDIDPTIRRTLHRTEHTRTSGGPLETDIKHGLEGTTVVLAFLSDLVFAVGFGDTLERLVKSKFGKRATGEKETGGIGSSPVGETVLDAITGKFV